MPLFGKSSKTPAEVVRGLKDSLAVLEKEGTGRRAEKAVEEVSRHLVTIAGLLFSCDTEQQADIVLAQMSQEMYNSALIPAILRNLARMEFEARKEAAEIFKHVLKRQIGTRTPTVEYIATCDEILASLVRGYQTPEICHNTGGMLRECVVHQSLAKIVLTSEQFQDFFTYIECPQFDIAADAFSTFKDLLTRHKAVASACIQTNYDTFFSRFNALLQSDNFVTKMNSVKLLNELLHDRNNLSVMRKYTSCDENLRVVMGLMLDPNRVIQSAAIELFKIFLANPEKEEEVKSILVKNREPLILYFENQYTKGEEESCMNGSFNLISQLKTIQIEE